MPYTKIAYKALGTERFTGNFYRLFVQFILSETAPLLCGEEDIQEASELSFMSSARRGPRAGFMH